MIRRNGVGDYVRTKEKKQTKRQMDDFDLRFMETSIYVLGENEWWDPMTSTKYFGDGMSPHAMRGPSVIIFYQGSGGGYESNEYHVNDPRPWLWIQKAIRDGHFNKETCGVMIEGKVEIKPLPVKTRKKVKV
jgi:hypothetical protein